MSQESLNPYAASLAGRDPLAVVKQTAESLRAAIERHRAGGTLDRPWAPGKWTPRQVLAHLADTEIVFGMRLRQAVAEDHHVIQPFDQDAWARGYDVAEVETALSLFEALRRWNVQFLAAQPGGVLGKMLTHPERGMMTFGTLVETMAGHDLNHLAQL